MITSNLDEIHFCCYFSCCCCCCRFWLVSLCSSTSQSSHCSSPFLSFSPHSSLLYSPLIIYPSPLQLHTLFPEQNALLFASADATDCLLKTSCSISPFIWLFLTRPDASINQLSLGKSFRVTDTVDHETSRSCESVTTHGK